MGLKSIFLQPERGVGALVQRQVKAQELAAQLAHDAWGNQQPAYKLQVRAHNLQQQRAEDELRHRRVAFGDVTVGLGLFRVSNRRRVHERAWVQHDIHHSPI